MIDVINAILEFITLTAILWIPVLALSLLSTKLTALLGRRMTLTLGFIGVPIHEFGHIIFCWLCGHKVTSFNLFTISMDGTLGYVNHAYKKTWLSPFTLLLIGLAPLVSGVVGLYVVTYLLRPDILVSITDNDFLITDLNSGLIVFEFLGNTIIQGDFLPTLVWATLSFSICLFMSPSRADFQSCKTAVLVCLCLFVGFSFISPEYTYMVGFHIKNALIALSYPLYICLITITGLSALILLFKLVRINTRGKRNQMG